MNRSSITDSQNTRVVSESMVNLVDENLQSVSNSNGLTDKNEPTLATINESNQIIEMSAANEEADDDLMNRMSVLEYMESVFGPSLHEGNANLTFVEKMRKYLRSTFVHVLVIVLVLFDSFCVAIELITDVEILKEKGDFKLVENIFKYLGFSILSVFVVEIILKIIFLFNEFIKSKLEIFDAVIVIVSFIVEIGSF